MYRNDTFNLDNEDDRLEVKRRDKALDYELCIYDLYIKLRDLSKYQKDKKAQDSYEAFLVICHNHNIDPVGE